MHSSTDIRTNNRFFQALDSGRPLLADGAMGTSLFALGLISGESPERWNLDAPERVRAVHQNYVEAGSDIILTNSFGGNSFRLKLHDLQDRVFEINRLASELAREASDSADRTVIVAGSMGPTGELLEPMGLMTPEACSAAYAEQARGLESGGADMLWLETLSDLNEVRAAVAGAREASDLPIAVTMSFDTNGRTMMGLTATEMALALTELGVAAFGANCGNNLGDTELAISQMQQATPDAVLISKANAGIPEWKGEGLVYSGSPAVMAAHADRLNSASVRIIGGCCGSTAEHLHHMRQVIDGDIAAPDIPAPGGSSPASVPTDGPRRRTRRRR